MYTYIYIQKSFHKKKTLNRVTWSVSSVSRSFEPVESIKIIIKCTSTSIVKNHSSQINKNILQMQYIFWIYTVDWQVITMVQISLCSRFIIYTQKINPSWILSLVFKNFSMVIFWSIDFLVSMNLKSSRLVIIRNCEILTLRS